MKGLKTIILVIFIVVTAVFFYLYKLQQIVNEGSDLFDEHCIKVNPLIIERKKNYINFLNLAKASASADLVMASIKKYTDSSIKYVEEENKWLNKANKVYNRTEVKLLIRGNMYKAALLQYKIYKADRDIARLINDMWQYLKDLKKQADTSQEIMKIRKEYDFNLDNYNNITKKMNSEFSLMRFILKVPETKCPKENFNIPDVNIDNIINPKPIYNPNS